MPLLNYKRKESGKGAEWDLVLFSSVSLFLWLYKTLLSIGYSSLFWIEKKSRYIRRDLSLSLSLSLSLYGLKSYFYMGVGWWPPRPICCCPLWWVLIPSLLALVLTLQSCQKDGRWLLWFDLQMSFAITVQSLWQPEIRQTKPWPTWLFKYLEEASRYSWLLNPHHFSHWYFVHLQQFKFSHKKHSRVGLLPVWPKKKKLYF